MNPDELPARRRRLTAVVVSVLFVWCGAIWTVAEKFQDFRYPVPVLSAVFFGVFATAATVVFIRLYVAGEKQRRDE